MASSSTESPRNSSRSYDSVRSAAHEEWVNTAARRAGGSASIRCRSVEALRSGLPRRRRANLLVRRDVVDGLPDGRDLLGVIVGDLDAELIFELHDQLD